MTANKSKLSDEEQRDKIDYIVCRAAEKVGEYKRSRALSHGGHAYYVDYFWSRFGKCCVHILQDMNHEIKDDSGESWESFAGKITEAGSRNILWFNRKISPIFFSTLLEIEIGFGNDIDEFLYFHQLAYFIRVECERERIPLRILHRVLLLRRFPPLVSYDQIDERLVRRMRREVAQTRKKIFYQESNKRKRNNE